MSKILTMASSGYQMSDTSLCENVPSSGLPIKRIPRKKIHCILPSSPWLADSKTNVPLGVLYIAGLLREQGHEIVVTSMLDKRYEGNIHLPESVMDSDVHMFGFCTPQFGEALELAAYIKDRNPDALLVAGGPHPSYEPKEVKEAGRQDAYHFKGTLAQRRDYKAADGRALFDTVIVMEGEVATLQMLTDWDAGKLQPYYYGDKADAMDLDAIPFPAWDLLPHDHIYNDGVAVMKKRYFESTKEPGTWPVMSMIGTRGCPYKCFVAGTRVSMYNGTEKLIESLRIGDSVLAINPETGERIAQRVSGVGQREADDVYEAELSDGTTFRATADHPFWTRDGWRELRSLVDVEIWSVSNLSNAYPEIRSKNVRVGGMRQREDTSWQNRRPEPRETSGSSSANLGDSEVASAGTFCANESNALSWTSALSWLRTRSSSCLFKADEGTQSDAQTGGRSQAVRDSQTVLQGRHCVSSFQRLSELWRTLAWQALSGMGHRFRGFWRSSFLDRSLRLWQTAQSRFHEFVNASRRAFQLPLLAHGGGYSDSAHGLRFEGMAGAEPLGGVSSRFTDCRENRPRVSADWVTLTKLTFVGRSLVYPITVEGTHTFVANGILTHNCTYCSTPWIGLKPRYRSPANQIAELKAIFDIGVRQVKWQDDTYTLHRTKLRELAEAIHAEFGGNTFASRVHTRVNTMDDHVAESLKMMSAKVVCFGIESGSQRVLDANQKGTRVAQNTQALIKAKEHGFYTIGFLVAGMAGETLETARETMDWLKNVRPYLDSCNLAVGIPYPGSRWWTHPQESGIDIVDYNYDNTWIVGFSARDEILVRPHGATIPEMFRIKDEMFQFLVSEGWAKNEWQEDVRIKHQQDDAVKSGVLPEVTAASTLTYAGH